MGALGLSSLSFLAPLALLGLLALPALWWLLRATPPQPTHALFPPMQLLARLTSAEETPVRTPWWLLLLRLLLAAILILAFAGPQWRANAPLDLPGTSDAPLLLVMETDWATAHDWEERLDRARRIVRTADDQGRAVGLLAMPQPFDTVPLPSDGAAVLAALDELRPQPASQDLSDALAQVTRTLDTEAWRNAAVVWMTSGLSKQADGMEALAALADRVDAALVHGKPPDRALSLDITPSGPTATLHTVAFDEGAITLPPRRELEGARVVALDISGRQLAAVPLTEANAADGSVLGFDLPVDVRNDIARIALQPTRHAGHVLLIDDRLDRRQVAIVGTQGSDDAQPLLSSTTYIERAIEPFADTVAPRTGDSNTEIARAIAGGADVLVLSGAVTLTPSTTADLQDWVARGGVLIRFASTSLADSDDPLLPVPLRAVDRQLGGALTWEEPQPIAPFRAQSPFAGLSIPDDVRIERQILSEPGAAVASNTYAELADATPLVTGEPRGEGHVILFHITAETSWSNLPLSVLFVDMLERLVGLASATSLQATDTAASAAPAPGGAAGPEPRAQEVQVLAPRAAVDGFGVLGSAPAHAEALLIDAAATPPATAATPPGFYGPADATFALNLFSEPPSLRAAASETFAGVPARALDVPIDQSVDFRPGLLTLALLLACLDALAVLWLSGGLGLKSGFARRAATSAGAMVLAAGLGLALLAPSPVAAQGSNQGSNVAEPGSSAQLQRIIAAVNLTRFAYVLTGDPQLDQRSREGIEGLTRILTQRTAFEPGPPFGIDPMTEELSVYPLIYWPMPDEPMAVPEQLVTRIDAYMNNGGTILFDTRDEQMNLMSGALTPQTANLRALLGALDIPPLEPVPDDHVLTKSFYLIDSFPGRFATGALWVETLPEVDEDARRPARGGDGVSPLMISGNDFASAWALSPEGLPLYATSPPDPVQREFAYRTGVNIAMYVMTGNYKADQVHIPALLERLIQ